MISCPITHHQCSTPECLQGGCTLQRGVAYSQIEQSISPLPPDASDMATYGHEADEERRGQEILAAQADALEAHALKYHHCAQIFALSSGKYALFGSYQVASGIELIAIGSWQELEEHVKAYRLLADQRAAEPRRISQKPRTAAAAADYADLFGDD